MAAAAKATALKISRDDNNEIKVIRKRKKNTQKAVSLRLDIDLYERVKTLIERTGADNVQDVMREGLELYEALISEAELGKVILVTDAANPKTNYPVFEAA